MYKMRLLQLLIKNERVPLKKYITSNLVRDTLNIKSKRKSTGFSFSPTSCPFPFY